MARSKKLTKNSEAVRHLRKLFETKQITGTEKHKVVYNMPTLFKEHSLSAFKSCYNRMPQEILSDPAEVEIAENASVGLARKCTLGNESVSKKRSYEELMGEDNDLKVSSASELPNEAAVVHPMYLLATWIEPETTTKRISVAIVLPSGVRPGSFSYRVEPIRRMEFDLSITWPEPLTSTKLLHAKWLQSEETDKITHYHPKMLAFEDALKTLIHKKDDDVVSIWKIPLLFPVESHVHDKFNMTWRNTDTKMLYIELKVSVDTYGLSNDNQAFEVVG